MFVVLVVVLFGGAYEDGHKAYKNKEYKKAVKFYTKTTKQGNFMAQLNLDIMYATGEGVKEDYKKAVDLWGKSCS